MENDKLSLNKLGLPAAFLIVSDMCKKGHNRVPLQDRYLIYSTSQPVYTRVIIISPLFSFP